MSKLIRTTVSDVAEQELQKAAQEQGIGLSLFLRLMLERWAKKRRNDSKEDTSKEE